MGDSEFVEKGGVLGEDLEDEGDTDGADADMEEAVSDILITGSGHSSWGPFTLTGRVRQWDGMISMVKEYVSRSVCVTFFFLSRVVLFLRVKKT